jgi:hypothetical protein
MSLFFQLERANSQYENYLADGNKLHYARLIRAANVEAISIILESPQLINTGMRANVLALLEHLEVWLALWDHHYAEKQPSPEDAFVFQNHIRFPKEEVGNLYRYFETSLI